MVDPPPPASPATRLPGLDLLRATAISWVLLYHLALFGLAPFRWPIVRFGWMGVDLFFVLSGFLIAGQLLRPWAEGSRPDVPRFFVRRLMRTLPAYWAVLAVYALIPAVREKPHLQPLWVLLSFTQNLLLGDRPNAFSHAWSLAVEEQFYLALPLILALLAIRPSAVKAVGAAAAILILGMALRAWLWTHEVAPAAATGGHSAPDAMAYMRFIYYPTYSRLDGLLAGAAAAAVKLFRPELWRRLVARPNLLLVGGLGGVILSAAFFRDQIAEFWPAVLGYPLLAASLAGVVSAGGEAGCVIGRRALPGAGALAAVSYSVYLAHKMVFHAVGAGGLPIPAALRPVAPAVAVVLGLMAGVALYWAVERPFLKLRDRLTSRARVSLAVAPQPGLAA